MSHAMSMSMYAMYFIESTVRGLQTALHTVSDYSWSNAPNVLLFLLFLLSFLLFLLFSPFSPFFSFFLLFSPFSTGGFILVSDYVRMEVTLVGASWDVVAGDRDGCGLHSFEVLWRTELPFSPES